MADSYKVNVTIASRNYPISVSSIEEEQGVRAAASKINKLVSNYESNYGVNDKQDVLAMCALQFASLIEVNKVLKEEESDEVYTEVSKINSKLESYLNK